jgi:hypothetical protein
MPSNQSPQLSSFSLGLMFPRASFVILGLVTAAIVATVILFYTRGPFGVWRQQMATGATYMKSFKDSDVPPWIERTKRLLAEWKPGLHPVGAYGLGGKPVPADLQQLGVIRIDILQDQVRYVWMGGMDHTELEVDRLEDGGFRFIAHYNEAQSEVIWPKRPNQAMELTTSHRTILLSLTTALSSGAMRVAVRGSSSWSR